EKLQEAARALQTALTGLGYRDVAVHGLEERLRESSSRNGDPVSLEQLIAMLRVIPPDLPREDWLHVVWGMKDANTVPHMDDDGRIDLLDRFSSGELGGAEPPGSYEGY